MVKKFKFSVSQKVRDHLIEAILIFTSVFFAFLLNDYRESSNEKETLKKSMRQIASEMQYNHERIESIFAYYSTIIHEIDSIRYQSDSNWEMLYGNNLSSFQGMQLPMLRSTAYQTFLNSGANNTAGLELAKSLADIYNVQTVIERLDNSFFDIATADRGFTSLPKVRHLAGIYVEILPDILLFYQNGKDENLKEYGYRNEIQHEKLRQIVHQKKFD